MALFGTLKTMPLPDLLQWLGTARLTGTLQVERNRVRKWIRLQEGTIIGCSSDDPPERLGHFLLSRGKITENQLRIALQVQEGSPKHLGRILVEMGALTIDDLSSHLEAKAEETIYSLFDWDDGTFRFDEDLGDVENILPVSLRVDDVLLRGVKRYDELKCIRSVFNDPGIVLKHTDKVPRTEVFKNRMARAIYESIDGERTVAGILLHVHGSEYLVTKFLYELHRNAYLEIVGVKRVAVPEPPADAISPGEPTRDTGTGAHVAVTEAAEPVAVTTTAAAVAEPAIETPAAAATGAAAVESGSESAEPVGDVPEVLAPSTKELEADDDSDAYQLDRLLEIARGLLGEGAYEEALITLDKAYRRKPDDESLRRLTLEAEAAFLEKAYRHYLPADKVPVLRCPVHELEREKISPKEFFLLSRIDGTWDVKSIIQVAPLREVEAMLTLKRMREKGVIELRDPDEA